MPDRNAIPSRAAICGNPLCGGTCWDNGSLCWHEITVGSKVDFEYGVGIVTEIGSGYVAIAQGAFLWFRPPEDVRKAAA